MGYFLPALVDEVHIIKSSAFICSGITFLVSNGQSLVPRSPRRISQFLNLAQQHP
jgi:hypothetical protein